MPVNAVDIKLDVSGQKEIISVLNRLARRMRDMKAPMTRIGLHMLRSFNDNFRAQGIPELGITWKPLSKWTLAARRRPRKKGKSSGKRILMDTGIMRMSLVSKNATGNIFDVTRNSVEVGTNINYAKKHQFGFRQQGMRIPGVKIKAFTRKDGSRVRAHTRTVVIPSTTTPARPFMAIKPSDEKFILKTLVAYMQKGAK